MGRYIRRRLITAIPVFFGITLLVFLMVNLAPGTITDLMGEGASSSADKAALEYALGLDQPLPVRYLSVADRTVPGKPGTVLLLRPAGEPA